MRFSSLSILILVTVSACLSGCATLFSKSIYPVTIHSTPQDVRFEVFDRYKNRIFSGTTPETVYLPASYLPFIRQRYTILITDPDFESAQMPVTFHIDGWYFANLLIPAFAPIGMLIVDPLSGSMFTLDYHCRRLTFNLKPIKISEHRDPMLAAPTSIIE
ncbi:hypothetical protein JCM31826_09150 [Thermaurantimonas aggregans]|uniref:Lipoprotein n=1 Tax=Thermaurantimonas aggregans TaxID=2173829 RepID=A0A401XKB6_9FLAO|nr:hypothetical protein [Thermaurantimonas aggregans]MCX8148377.1 hypothetical protein [Thermaurantimonas aggregans]GCD77433.1 hypothetical protein JCM31826_09150 [Thermaurantimonas aggregans]